MADYEFDPRGAGASGRNQDVIDRLVFASLREQTRARRWRVFFMLFFVIYLTVVTIVLFTGGGEDYDAIGEADGDRHTALVKLSGIISDGEQAGARNIIAGLKAAFKHEDTAGVVLEINSPGGSPVQSAYIYDEIMRLKQKYPDKPMYVVVSDICASGGYFVASAADRIYVNKSSLVGSIGVRMDNFGFVDMMKKIGVERRLLTAGKDKALMDPFLPEKNDQVAHLQAMLDEVHGNFIDAVKQGRGDRLDESQDLFTGLIWSGEKSVSLGLADDFGTTGSVARELGAEQIVDFTPKVDLLQRIAERIGTSVGRGISEILLNDLAVR
ncbi:MAG: S49 family peptidase [Gammaproteobacteria bacterium]|jgi:protease-4